MVMVNVIACVDGELQSGAAALEDNPPVPGRLQVSYEMVHLREVCISAVLNP